MNEAMTPVPANDPLMVAWTKYKATDEYANSKKWAVYPENVDGSLWAAFVEGYRSQTDTITALRAELAATHRLARLERAKVVREIMTEAEMLTVEPHDPRLALPPADTGWNNALRRILTIARGRTEAADIAELEGLVLVPKEPTEAMIAAGWIDKEDVSPAEIWKAMNDAAMKGAN